MSADDTVQFVWQVYAKDWDGFKERVGDLESRPNDEGELESRVNNRLIRYHLHQAIDEYADEDASAEIEEIIDQHVRAAGRRPADGTGKKFLRIRRAASAARRHRSVETSTWLVGTPSNGSRRKRIGMKGRY